MTFHLRGSVLNCALLWQRTLHHAPHQEDLQLVGRAAEISPHRLLSSFLLAMAPWVFALRVPACWRIADQPGSTLRWWTFKWGLEDGHKNIVTLRIMWFMGSQWKTGYYPSLCVISSDCTLTIISTSVTVTRSSSETKQMEQQILDCQPPSLLSTVTSLLCKHPALGIFVTTENGLIYHLRHRCKLHPFQVLLPHKPKNFNLSLEMCA